MPLPPAALRAAALRLRTSPFGLVLRHKAAARHIRLAS